MDPVERPRVSAYMITFNNERTVERALRSVSWADEIVVVDSFSSDRTMEIVGQYAHKIEQRAWPGFRDQYRYASELCTHDWVLFIDADEEVSPKLADEIQSELSANCARPAAERVCGYHAQRRTYFLGRWHMHGAWVPDHEIRLYDRRRGSWEGGLHAKVLVKGPEAEFRHYYYHFTYEDLTDEIGTLNRYSSGAAADLVEAGKPFRLWRMLGNPPARFIRDYFLKGGFRDGLAGFIVTVNNMFYIFSKYAKQWEARQGFDRFDDGSARP